MRSQALREALGQDELDTPIRQLLGARPQPLLAAGTTLAAARARLAEANAQSAAVIDSEGELVGVIDIFSLVGWDDADGEASSRWRSVGARDQFVDVVAGRVPALELVAAGPDAELPLFDLPDDGPLSLLEVAEAEAVGKGLHLVEAEPTVDELMTRDVVTLQRDAPVGLAVSVLVDASRGGVAAVVDERARPVGTITLSDIGSWLASGITRAWLHQAGVDGELAASAGALAMR